MRVKRLLSLVMYILALLVQIYLWGTAFGDTSRIMLLAAIPLFLFAGPASYLFALIKTGDSKKYLKPFLLYLLIWMGVVVLIYLIRVNYTEKKFWELLRGSSSSV